MEIKNNVAVPMPSKEECLRLAEHERARDKKAWCETVGVNYVRSEETGDLQLATEFYMIALNRHTCTQGDPRGEGQRMMIFGHPTDAAHCRMFTYLDAERPPGRHTTVCIRAPVWIVDKRHWRLVGNRIVDKTPAKAP